jgi:hypothetical protein
VEFTGPIESMQPNAWIVGGLAVEIDANTSIVGAPQINRLAAVKGVTGPSGMRATSITIESLGEADTTPEPKETATPEVKESTEMPRPSSTPEPGTTSTPTPRPTASPQPTAIPQPTATAEPVEVEFTGGVQVIEAAAWNIDGTAISVNANTEIRGSISVGQRVKVKALRQGNGQLIAVRIEPIDGGGDGSSGGGSNRDGNPTPEPTENHNQNGNENQNQNGSDGNSNDDHGGDNSNSNENHNGNDNSNDHSGNGD